MITIDFRRPTLEDKELLTSYFRKYPSRSCERTFVNVYLWAKFYQVGYAMVENTVVFRSKENGLSFAYPVGDPKDVKRTIEVLMEYSRNRGIRLRCTVSQKRTLHSWKSGIRDSFKSNTTETVQIMSTSLRNWRHFLAKSFTVSEIISINSNK